MTDGSSSDTDAVEICDKLKALPAISQPKKNPSPNALEQIAEINVVGVLPNVSICITYLALRIKNQGGTAF